MIMRTDVKFRSVYFQVGDIDIVLESIDQVKELQRNVNEFLENYEKMRVQEYYTDYVMDGNTNVGISSQHYDKLNIHTDSSIWPNVTTPNNELNISLDHSRRNKADFEFDSDGNMKHNKE